MFDRYCVTIECDGIRVCKTYFYTIDQVIKFVIRFDISNCLIYVDDELFPDRHIDVSDLISLWNSKR